HRHADPRSGSPYAEDHHRARRALRWAAIRIDGTRRTRPSHRGASLGRRGRARLARRRGAFEDERVIERIQRCGPYELIDELGRGGMATVYRIRRTGDDGFSCILALKRLRLSDPGPETIQMLVEEARVMASLNHPNVVSLLDY